MTLMGLLEVGIGLAFIYMLFCTFCSGINEWIAQQVGRRGEFLRRGLKRLLCSEEIYLRLLAHPLIAPTWKERPGRGPAPSYLAPEQFASSLVDIIYTRAQTATGGARLPNTFDGLRKAAECFAKADQPIGQVLNSLLDRADGKYDQALKEIASWYSSGMDRVSGWYKGHSQKCLFWLGLAMAVLFNVDTIDITMALWRSDSLRSTLVSQATQAVESGKVGDVVLQDVLQRPPTEAETKAMIAAMQGLEKAGLPIGFSCLGPDALAGENKTDVIRHCWENTKASTGGEWTLKLLGWLLTALAATFGAPFWYDLLGKIVSLRGGGPKPKSIQRSTPVDVRVET